LVNILVILIYKEEEEEEEETRKRKLVWEQSVTKLDLYYFKNILKKYVVKKKHNFLKKKF
jgi:hypothetical protein